MPLQIANDLPTNFPTIIEGEENRFWRKVNKSTNCWLWTGLLDKDGYGWFHLAQIKGVRPQKLIRAHRFSYEKLNGIIAAGLVTDHLCRNRACVNPAHLEIVTPRENTLRGVGSISKRNLPLGVNIVGSGFVARIHINGSRKYLGYFSTTQSAHKAYKEASYALTN